MDCKFKEKLREELNFQDLSVKQLSLKTGIPVRTLENYLGKRDSIPPVDNAYLISKALRVSLEWLVTGENPQFYKNDTENDLHSIVRDLSNLPENIKDAFKTIARYTSKIHP